MQKGRLVERQVEIFRLHTTEENALLSLKILKENLTNVMNNIITTFMMTFHKTSLS